MKNLALAVLVVLSSASLAYADDAQEHVSKGTRFYNIQDWSNALKEYKTAYAADPKPETLWAIAQTQRLSGDCRSAILTYKAFMRTASTAGANAADELVKKCESDLAAQQRAVEAPPPPPQQQTTQATQTPPPPPTVRVEKKTPTPWILDPLGDVLGVIGLGGLVTGGVFLVVGNVGMSDTAKAATYQAYDHSVDVARVQQQVGVGVAIGGAVFTGLAIWRWVAVANRNKRESVSLSPLPGGAFASYSMRF